MSIHLLVWGASETERERLRRCLPEYEVTFVQSSSREAEIRSGRTLILRKMENRDRLILCGFSEGALIALSLAEELPVDGVAAICPPIRLKKRLAVITGIREAGLTAADCRRILTRARAVELGLNSLRCSVLLLKGEDGIADPRAVDLLLTAMSGRAPETGSREDMEMLLPGFVQEVSESDPAE